MWGRGIAEYSRRELRYQREKKWQGPGSQKANWTSRCIKGSCGVLEEGTKGSKRGKAESKLSQSKLGFKAHKHILTLGTYNSLVFLPTKKCH